MEKLTVERSIWIAAPRERVWQAVTDPAQVVQWFVPNLPGAQMQRDDSGKVIMQIGEMGVDFVTLDIVEPLHRAAYRSLPDRLISVIYALDDENEGTRVTLTMSGFESLLEDPRADRLERSGAGWEEALNNLRAYVDGMALPFPQAYVGPLFGYWRVARKKLAVERSIWIAAPRERVWRAVTDPKQIQQWFSPNTTWELSALEVGGRLFVRDPESGAEMYVQVIELIDPPHRFVTRAEPEPPAAPEVTAYTLLEEQGGTRLTVTHSGYELEPEDARWNNMERNTFGFGMMLQNAKAYLEGNSLPFPWGF
jgi:uncharacterized protein YndB with AHSA1/START domain